MSVKDLKSALKLGGANGTWANAVWTTCTIAGAVVILLFDTGAILVLVFAGAQGVLGIAKQTSSPERVAAGLVR
jgi:hypothetical protein